MPETEALLEAVPLLAAHPTQHMCTHLAYTLWTTKTWQYICDHDSEKSWWISNSYISGNTNECHMQISYLSILVSHSATCLWDQSSWYWWAVTASTACLAQPGAVTDWPMVNTLATCVCANGGHFEHILWLSICFLCTWKTLCFTTRLMQSAKF